MTLFQLVWLNLKNIMLMNLITVLVINVCVPLTTLPATEGKPIFIPTMPVEQPCQLLKARTKTTGQNESRRRLLFYKFWLFLANFGSKLYSLSLSRIYTFQFTTFFRNFNRYYCHTQSVARFAWGPSAGEWVSSFDRWTDKPATSCLDYSGRTWVETPLPLDARWKPDFCDCLFAGFAGISPRSPFAYLLSRRTGPDFRRQGSISKAAPTTATHFSRSFGWLLPSVWPT